MTTEAALQTLAGFIGPLTKEYADVMEEVGFHDLPNDLANAITKAGDALADVGELLVKYAPNQEDSNG